MEDVILDRINIPGVETLLEKELGHRANVIRLGEVGFYYTIDYYGVRRESDDDEYMPMKSFNRAYYENIRLRKNFSGIRMDYESFNQEPKWVLWVMFSGSDDVKILFDFERKAHEVKAKILKWGANV